MHRNVAMSVYARGSYGASRVKKAGGTHGYPRVIARPTLLPALCSPTKNAFAKKVLQEYARECVARMDSRMC
jgi:hypothetical protein